MVNIIYGSGVETLPAGQPQIYHMVQYQGPPRVDERSVLCLHLAKKYSEFLAKNRFFLVFSYI